MIPPPDASLGDGFVAARQTLPKQFLPQKACYLSSFGGI
jgi:hypothetical protein